ncbi:CDP-glycerol:poly(glycerophosphate) glycerophosphotransferase [Clostridiales bacterium oral taxon 876 str. F0540]|nr:CDP-glycerol:poly(glycerophosphate) glycerophosphotransferase [Clostridiales bacterium oral taxon 876 str. F0540]
MKNLILIYTSIDKKIIIDDDSYDLFEYIGTMTVEEKSFNYMRNLEMQTVKGKSIENLYTYDGIPLYFFVRPTFYEKIKNIIFYVELIEKIISDQKYKCIVNTDDVEMYIIAKNIFELDSQLLDKTNKSGKKGVKYTLKLYKRYIKGIYSYFRFCGQRRNNDILAITHTAHLNKLNNESYKGYFDTLYGTIINDISKRYKLCEVQMLTNSSHLDKSLKYKKDYIPFELFVIYRKIFGNRLIDKEKITNNLELIDKFDFQYSKYDLKDIIIKAVMVNYESECLHYLSEILTAEKVINKYEFKKCLVSGEGDRGRCFVVACHRLGIPCYAIQHGIINETSPNYIISTSSECKLVPSITFLWGEKYQKMLVNNSNVYTNSNTRVVGQVRTDLLMKYKNSISNSHNSIRILYATQYLKDLLEPATEMLFKSLNMLKTEYELVIKLHPADNYKDFYDEMIKKFNIKNVKIVKDYDLYSLIAWSDKIVSVHSTVVLEGALMQVPSICILLPKYSDEGGFVRDGISTGAKDETELAYYLSDKNTDYIENSKLYLKNNFYKIDGNVTYRIVQEIETYEVKSEES